MIPPREPGDPRPPLLPKSGTADALTAHPTRHDATIEHIPSSQPTGSDPHTELDPDAAAHPDATSFLPSGNDTEAPPAGTPGEPTHVPPTVHTNGSATPTVPPIPPADAVGTRVGRFTLQELHAKGGLGEVFTAHDAELNRTVAVKRIQARYADDPASRRRFLSEAELTARLDHPGVVPVFGLVCDKNGRPCYAMRLIRGDTLKHEIERYHSQGSEVRGQESERTEHTGTKAEQPGLAAAQRAAFDAQPRSVAFRHLLQRFIAVCQAIAYAHSRKIIHRDIKPANVMVGAFGETLVVDWGLAKALDEGPDAEKVLKAVAAHGFRHDPDATEAPSHLTAAGTAIGTPAYMAPEQASGRVDLVGTAADVYSLGATLFVILTGKTAFTGGTADTLDRVRRGDFRAPRAIQSGVPLPLDAVCRKAMALRPEDRYATPLELAADIERWLSDEPVSCYRDPFFASLARWARRNPARVAAGVSLLFAGIVAAVVLAWAINQGRKNTADQRDRATEAEKQTAAALVELTGEQGRTQAALTQVTQEKKNTDKQRHDAEAARDVARSRYEAAVRSFDRLVNDIQEQLADRAGTQDLRRNLLLQAQKGLTELIAGGGADQIGADRTIVAAHRRLGDVYLMLGKTKDARAEYELAVKHAAEVLTKLQDRPPEAGAEVTELEAKRDLGRSYLRLADIHLQTGHTAAARRALAAALDLFQQVLRSRPDDRGAIEDVAAAREEYAEVLMERGEARLAADECKTALDARRKLATEAGADPKAGERLADSLGQYAEILMHGGHTAETPDDAARATVAHAAAAECLALRAEAFEKHRHHPEARRKLAAAHACAGELLLDRGLLDPAKKQFTAAQTLLDRLRKDESRSVRVKADLAAVHGRLAAVALRTGENDDTLGHATLAQELNAAIATDDPDSVRAKRHLAQAFEQLGEAFLACGRKPEAIAAFHNSVTELKPIAGDDVADMADPESARAKQELARALEHLAAGHLATDEPGKAVAALAESVLLREKVLTGLDGCPQATRELARALGELAEANRAAGSRVAARTAATRAVGLLHDVLTADPKCIPARRELAAAMGRWGQSLADAGNTTAALIALGKSVDDSLALMKEDAANAQAKAAAATAWERAAAVYADLGQTAPATLAADESLKLRFAERLAAGETKANNREIAQAMIRLADTYAAIREFDTARTWYRAARGTLAGDLADAATAAVARRAEEKLALVNAVEKLSRDPARMPPEVPVALRVPALRAAIESLLKSEQPVAAAAVASQLTTTATSATDLRFAARTLARCAGSLNLTPAARTGYATEAVTALQLAVKAGFRGVEELSEEAWNPCRELPAFQKLRDEMNRLPHIAPAPRTR